MSCCNPTGSSQGRKGTPKLGVARGAKGPPSWVLASSKLNLVSPEMGAMENAVLLGLQKVVGDAVPITGGGSMTFVRGMGKGVPTPVGDDIDTGVAFALLWPDCGVTSAFCCPAIPMPNRKGVITKLARGTQDTVLLEIDGRRATDVLFEWNPALYELVKHLKPEDVVYDGMPFEGMVPNGTILGAMGYPPEPSSVMLGTPMCQVGEANFLHMPCVVMGTDDDDNELFKSVAPFSYDLYSGSVTVMAPVHQDQVIMMGSLSAEALVKRTPTVAKQMLRNQGLSYDQVRGALSVMCCANVMWGGDEKMEAMAEELGDALGWAPTLGITLAPEFGHMGTLVAEAGNVMYSCAVLGGVNKGGAVAQLDTAGTVREIKRLHSDR